MEMKKIKYLHILWMDDLKFYKNLVEMINKEKIYFTERISTIRTKTELEYAIDIKTILDIHHINRADIEGAIISSVVPQITSAARLAVQKILKKDAMILGPD